MQALAEHGFSQAVEKQYVTACVQGGDVPCKHWLSMVFHKL